MASSTPENPPQSSLQQLQLNYDQVQDRLTLSIFTQDMSEYQFWITRRATVMLWNVLVQLLQADQRSQLEQMRASREIIQQIQDERARRRPTAEQMANPMSKRPLGDQPMLLFRVRARPPKEENEPIALLLEDEKGHSLQIAGTSTIILALCQLIRQTILLADWNLELEVKGEKSPNPLPSTPSEKSFDSEETTQRPPTKKRKADKSFEENDIT